mmetsp:Transcript_35053/g.58032  ORF Transcript_35053/g.58032 Transcript_35053/m.58032 type:complete len:228 (+) Transcript_35053:3568-4251(+)
MILEQASKLQLDVIGCAVALVFTQSPVGAHDFLQFDRQIVLSASRLDLDGWPNLRWRHWQHRDAHPIGPRKLRIVAEALAIGIRNALENAMCALSRDLELPLMLIGSLAELSLNHKAVLLERRLSGRAGPACRLGFGHVHDCTQPVRRILLPGGRLDSLRIQRCSTLVRRLVAQNDRARETHAPKCLDDCFYERDMVHGLGELNVPKMARTLGVLHTARGAFEDAID